MARWPGNLPGIIGHSGHNDHMGRRSDTQPSAGHAHPESATPSDVPPAAPGDTPSAVPPEHEGGRTIAQQAATVSAKLGPIARRAGDRAAAASPTTLLLSLLGLLVTMSVVAALTFDGSLGVAAIVLFTPLLSAAVGAVTMRCIDDRRKSLEQREAARDDMRTSNQIEHTLDYVDGKLTAALTQFGTERHNEAVIGMFQAKAATELYLGAARPPETGRAGELEPENIDLVTQYGLAELLTPRRVGEQTDSSTASSRSCA